MPEPVEGKIKRKLTLDNPPRPDDGMPSPIPIPTLRGWGLNCNVAPMELTDEALMSGRADLIPDDDDEALQ